jgi:4-amino-4-deoxy-L-arabinose transferase-like glycosyltransferase
MLAVFLLALAVRITYLIFFRHSPFFDGLIVDAQWHDEWAARWARGDWSMHGRAFFRAPFYPLWLSVVYRIFGHDLLAARIVQAVLGAATASALAGCGHEIGGRKTAIAAGVVASLYGTLIFFEGEILIPALLLFLVTWSFFLLVAARRTPVLLLSSLLLGLAIITRPTTIALLPVFAIVYLSKARIASVTRATTVFCLVLAALPPIAVTLANARAEGTFVFIASQGGINFYAGNNPYASGRDEA